MRTSNMKIKAVLGVLGSLSLVSSAFAGTPMLVNPAVSNHAGAPASGSVSRTGTGDMTLRLINSCYGTNLRGTSNPLAPSSIVEAKINLLSRKDKTSAPVATNLMVKYPALVADKDGITKESEGPIDPSMYSGPAGMKVRIFGNTVEATVPMPVSVVVDGSGDLRDEKGELLNGQGIWPVSFDTYSFYQHVSTCEGGAAYGKWGWSTYIPTYPCGAYMGKNGPLSHTFEGVSIASDNSTVEISVKFPGQTGYCGGYYSPLMLFFDNDRPKFNGQSKFQLSAASKTYWVEAGAPGHFLAIDRNYNGKIDGKEELFGDQDSDTNGFESLKEIDSNKDGIVNSKDKKFKRLLLWQDKNGDGVSTPDELELLSKRVTKISLAYKKLVNSYGDTAEARQVSQFWFKDGAKTKMGMVEDIWFAPVSNSNGAPIK